MRTVVVSEAEARASAVCVGCGQPKDSGSGLVCWHCFKRSADPLKWAGVSFTEWQRRQAPCAASALRIFSIAQGNSPVRVVALAMSQVA